MDTWRDLAKQNRQSASVLIDKEHYRSVISRAYYAVYARVTVALLNDGVTMPVGREGPSHKKLCPLIETALKAMDQDKRRALSRIVGRLYTMRVVADYMPSSLVDGRDGREAITLMTKVFHMI